MTDQEKRELIARFYDWLWDEKGMSLHEDDNEDMPRIYLDIKELIIEFLAEDKSHD